MTRQKRRLNTKTRQSASAKRRATPRRAKRGRAASATAKRAVARPRRTVAQTAADRRATELFEQQIHDVWNRFGQACLQFAEGFNNEIGAHHLHVELSADSIVAKLAMGGELMVQLDREHKHVGCYITSQCGDLGSCVVEQPPIGLAVDGDRLCWVFGTTAMAEDDLAVKLMTELVQADTIPTSAASR